MTKKEILDTGIDRGICVASWCEIPEIGIKVRLESEGLVEVTEDNLFDTCISLCFESEANDRSYSPFEFTAKELNDLVEKKPYDVWELFEAGIYIGFKKELKVRFKEGR